MSEMSFIKLLLSNGWFSKRLNQVEPLQTSASSDTVSDSVISRPRFDELPLKQGHPKGSAWGLWGDHDERGTLNLITDDVVRAASAELIKGIVINLK